MIVRPGYATVANSKLNSLLISKGYDPIGIDYRMLDDGYQLFRASYYKTTPELYDDLVSLSSHSDYKMIRIKARRNDDRKY